MTQTHGIFQSDVIIRSAIIAGIADLRQSPWLLDYVFASLPKDSLTAREYGGQEIQRAKDWFLATNIAVFMNTRVDSATLPCITIGLKESSESDFTFSDTHYQTAEPFADPAPALATFTPVSYTASTGTMVTPKLSSPVYEGMILQDTTGKKHPIIEVLNETSFKIAPGTIADFTDTQLKVKGSAFMVELESAVFKETYEIGVHCQGEAVHTTYLHSILVFILLRYKQALFEARGFERSQFSSSDFTENRNFEPELVFSRFINLYGYVRNYWPKSVKPVIAGVEQNIQTPNLDDTLERIGDLDPLTAILFPISDEAGT